MPRLRNAAACLRAAGQATARLKSALEPHTTRPPGEYPLRACCQAPYLFLIAAETEACRTFLTQIKNHLLNDSGELLEEPAEQGSEASPAPVAVQTWVALAAQLCGRYELSLPVANQLATRQGRSTGGVYDMAANGERQNAADTRSTAGAGLLWLQCGLSQSARNAGRFLTKAVQQQMGAKRFFVRLDSLGRPVRKSPKKGSETLSLGKVRGRTEFSYLGLPIIFLAKLHLATREPEWLDAAMDYFAIAEQYGRETWTGPDVGTLGWGAAALYDLTRRRFYYDAAEAIAQFQIEQLEPEGCWPARTAADKSAILPRTASAAICLLQSVREAQ